MQLKPAWPGVQSSVALHQTANWLKENQLVLNTEKTKLIFFKTKNKQLNDDNELLPVNDETYKLNRNLQFLGITLDEFLSWDSHVEHPSVRLARIG